MNSSSRTLKSPVAAGGVVLLVATFSAIGQQTPPTADPNDSHAPIRTQPHSTQNRPITVLPASDQFTAMDTDKDGKIFVAEYTSATMAAFKSMDKDGDGAISGVELTEAQSPSSGSPSPLSSAQIAEVDVNKDVRITAVEMSSGAARMFKNLDINADGFLSEHEISGRQYRTDTEASADSRAPRDKDGAKDSQADK